MVRCCKASALSRSIGSPEPLGVALNRIERSDRGEQGRWSAAATAAADEVADRNLVRANAAGERRGDTGELQVQPSVLDGGLGSVDGGTRGDRAGPRCPASRVGN